MDIKTILAKIAKGEELTDEEKKFAGEYKGTDNDNRIPKSRLDEEIAKRNAAETKSSEFEKKIAELTEKLEAMQSAGMTEAEKAKAEAAKQLKSLTAQVAALTKERDEAAKKAADMEFSNSVHAIAEKHKFLDADYLGYKLKAAGLALDDEEKVTGFMGNLAKESPNLFRSEVKSGAGTGTGGSAAGAGSTGKARLDELNKKSELSSREVAEVIQLTEQIKNEKNGG